MEITLVSDIMIWPNQGSNLISDIENITTDLAN
jgi:hypothetical protein